MLNRHRLTETRNSVASKKLENLLYPFIFSSFALLLAITIVRIRALGFYSLPEITGDARKARRHLPMRQSEAMTQNSKREK